ncbi:helix-turn-helix transcriptional regulator [Variovorax boronicumulans]
MSTVKPSHMSGAQIDAWLGIGKSTRYSWQDPKSPYHDPTWPLAIKLGTRRATYVLSEVEAWLAGRPRSRLAEGGDEQ